jgi:molybdenum cofactor cytidylyltransferase
VIAAILLAAGESRRMGHGANEVRSLAERAGASVVVNDRYAEGRASSLRAGAAAVSPGAAEITVLNVDQPRPASVTSRLLAEHVASGALITLPTYDGKRGHPAFLCGSLLPELCGVDDATEGLRAVIDRHAANIRELAFETPIVLLDINTLEDYEGARTEFEK